MKKGEGKKNEGVNQKKMLQKVLKLHLLVI